MIKKILSRKLYYFDLITKIISVLLGIGFLREFIKSASSDGPIASRTVIFCALLSVGCNIGLWLASTKVGRKYRVITTLLMLPTFIGGPMIVGYYNHILAIIFLFHLFFVIFYLYQRRNHEISS